jgi:hypothetical protein
MNFLMSESTPFYMKVALQIQQKLLSISSGRRKKLWLWNSSNTLSTWNPKIRDLQHFTLPLLKVILD